MSTSNTGAPSTSADFNRQYTSKGHWMWSDTRIPHELKELVTADKPRNSLELGCGLGRFSEYMADHEIAATAVDFSSVAIERARERVSNKFYQPTYLVGDVTHLDMLTEPFDFAFDVGCFHCLDAEAQQKYIQEAYRLLKPGAILLIWTLDHSPSDMKLTPEYMDQTFFGRFCLVKSKASRRRIIASHWYWLMREE